MIHDRTTDVIKELFAGKIDEEGQFVGVIILTKEATDKMKEASADLDRSISDLITSSAEEAALRYR